MTLRLVDAGWSAELQDALRADASALRIVCPFIKIGALERLLALRPRKIQVLTRFNLGDFVDGVSDIAALRRLLDTGARVRGIKNLHAKLYVFGSSRAIVTSANLTGAALDRNQEFGAVTQDSASIATCHAYFERLWRLGGTDLAREQLDNWETIVARRCAEGARPGARGGLADFGADVGDADDEQPAATLPVAVADAGQAFVKFLGTGDDREPLAFNTLDEVRRAGCHWALAYPAAQRPRSVQDGSVMFIARLTRDPNDFRVFGRAMGLKHVPGRDDATPQDISVRDFKRTWSRYIRVHHAEFVAGPLGNGVSLNELIGTLGVDSFESTRATPIRVPR